MRLRERLARSALSLPAAVEAALPCLLPRDALTSFNKTHFSRRRSVLIQEAAVGLYEEEAKIIDALGLGAGRALCLGCGAGREAFALARRGFAATGIDQVEEALAFARAYAAEHALDARFFAADLGACAFDGPPYELVTLFNVGYSYIPSRRARVGLLARCRAALSPSGRCALSFAVRAPSARERRWSGTMALAGRLLGNPQREVGDRVIGDGNFIHFFPSPESVGEEAVEAGFRVVSLDASPERGAFAVLAR